MKSYIKLLSIIAIVSICADASGTGTTGVHHRDVESTTRISARDVDIQSSTIIGIKRDIIENGTTRVAREESLNVSRRSVPHVHRQFLSTTAKPNRVKSSIGDTTRSARDASTSHSVHAREVETTRASRDVNVTKREDVFNHTVHARADETTRSSRDASTSHMIHARGAETTRLHRDLNATKRAAGHKDKPNKVKLAVEDTTRSSRDVSTTHIVHARAVDTTTRVSRDLNVTKREDVFNHTVIARADETTRLHRDLNVTRRAAAHKDKPNKVKLSVEETTRPSRDITTSHIIHAREVESTTRSHRDLNVTRRAAGHKEEKKPNKVKLAVEDTTRSSRDVSTTHIIHAREVDTTTRVSRDLNVTKREDVFNHTVIARADETTRSSRDVSTSHNIHAREVETTTRSSRDVNVTKREDVFNHTVHARAEETTRSSRDMSTSRIIHDAREIETTRVARDVNTTRRAAHKKEKATTAKQSKVVKLSVDDVVTNFTNAKVRSIDEDTTRAAIVARELFGGDLNVTKRAIETTTTTVAGKIVRRGVVEPERSQMLLFVSDDNSNNGGGDDDTDDNGDE